MSRLHRHAGIAAAALILAVCACGPAFAGDAACLWDHLPTGVTTAVIDAGLSGDVGKMRTLSVEADIQTAANACGYGARPQKAVADALMGIELQRVGETWFQRKLNIGPDRLDVAWRRLGADTQAKLMADIQSPTTDNDLIGRASNAIAADLGVSDPKVAGVTQENVGNFIGFYMGGRSLRAINEPQL